MKISVLTHNKSLPRRRKMRLESLYAKREGGNSEFLTYFTWKGNENFDNFI